MYLDELFNNTPHVLVNQLSIDSRVPMKDCIFFCISGIKYDGHQYIKEAIKNGASIIVHKEEIEEYDSKVIYIQVSNVADCLNDIAAKFYDYPSLKLETYLSCGCNGTSSISHILLSLLSNYKQSASIGVCGIRYKGHNLLNNVPTLTILDNQKYLNEFVKNDVKACVLEATALSLSYKKLDSLKPDVFIYSSTNEDSSRYKEIGNNYYDSICSYLYTLDDSNNILLNRDDVSYDELKKACGNNVYTYGLSKEAYFRIEKVVLGPLKSSFTLLFDDKSLNIETKLIGLYNIYNLTSCLAALYINGYNIEELVSLVPNIEPLEGVLEPINLGQNYNVIVDCCDNSTSIEAIFDFASSITSNNNHIYVLWGVSESYDDEDIETLASISNKYIDHLFVSEEDNFNGEAFDLIYKHLSLFKPIKPIIIENRQIAIESAIELLDDGDTLLIIGKGNENFIIRDLGKEAYVGDKNVAISAIKKRLSENNIEY